MTICDTYMGREAIAYAREHGLRLGRYGDKTGPAREGLSVDEAEEIAERDATLIYLSVVSEIPTAPPPPIPYYPTWPRPMWEPPIWVSDRTGGWMSPVWTVTSATQ